MHAIMCDWCRCASAAVAIPQMPGATTLPPGWIGVYPQNLDVLNPERLAFCSWRCSADYSSSRSMVDHTEVRDK